MRRKVHIPEIFAFKDNDLFTQAPHSDRYPNKCFSYTFVYYGQCALKYELPTQLSLDLYLPILVAAKADPFFFVCWGRCWLREFGSRHSPSSAQAPTLSMTFDCRQFFTEERRSLCLESWLLLRLWASWYLQHWKEYKSHFIGLHSILLLPNGSIN